MNCCANCFGDRVLRKDIIPPRSIEIGRCSYCGSEDVEVLPPSQLTYWFELLASAYRRDDSGKLLITWFREDWAMFDHPNMDDSRAKDLLAEILDDVEVVQESFSPAGNLEADQLSKWEKFREELMYHNRFFPKESIDLDRLELLLDLLTLEPEEVPSLWYRARLQTGETPLTIAEMGAPPKRIAPHGRANPVGIPCLYLGSTKQTAVSEIRPHTGELACVADFRTPSNLKLVDLRNPRKRASPFLMENEEDVGKMRSDIPFLERLGDELTRPVLPQAAAIDYTPSQYLCEFIKKCGYKGVIYRSSVGEGMNLALFDPPLAEPGNLTQYRVASVSVNVEVIDGRAANPPL